MYNYKEVPPASFPRRATPGFRSIGRKSAPSAFQLEILTLNFQYLKHSTCKKNEEICLKRLGNREEATDPRLNPFNIQPVELVMWHQHQWCAKVFHSSMQTSQKWLSLAPKFKVKGQNAFELHVTESYKSWKSLKAWAELEQPLWGSLSPPAPKAARSKENFNQLIGSSHRYTGFLWVTG